LVSASVSASLIALFCLAPGLHFASPMPISNSRRVRFRRQIGRAVVPVIKVGVVSIGLGGGWQPTHDPAPRAESK
jgi:hypothetical protein